MADKEYRFDPDTLSYEVVKEPLRIRLYRLSRKAIVLFIIVCIINLAFSLIVPRTPKMARLERERENLLQRYDLLDDRIAAASQRLDALQSRDNDVYRPLFGADTTVVPGVYVPYPDSVYTYLGEYAYGERMRSSWEALDAVSRRLYRQSLSLDQLQGLATDKESMASSIPAIWPIDKRNLRNNLGAFGGRLHPIHKRYIKHDGLDMPAHIGDPVYATGNGVVKMTDIGYRSRGYGRQILIDHGFGYQTRYAHLSQIDVEPGQVVHRGERIGRVGNTGASTGPHLHYEVIFMNTPRDPVNYFRRDMSEEEFERIINAARETTYEPLPEE